MPNTIKNSKTKSRLRFYKNNGDKFHRSFKTIYLNNTPYYKIIDTINYNHFATYKNNNYVPHVLDEFAINY